jgi:hypothetical protein
MCSTTDENSGEHMIPAYTTWPRASCTTSWMCRTSVLLAFKARPARHLRSVWPRECAHVHVCSYGMVYVLRCLKHTCDGPLACRDEILNSSFANGRPGIHGIPLKTVHRPGDGDHGTCWGWLTTAKKKRRVRPHSPITRAFCVSGIVTPDLCRSTVCTDMIDTWRRACRQPNVRH